MKYSLLLIFIFLNSCNSNPSKETPKEQQLYDIRTTYASEEDSTIVERKIPKYRVIYPAGRIYIYEATYIGVEGDTLSQEKVEWMATGKRTEFSPNRQDIMVYKYHYSPEDSIRFIENPTINKKANYANRWKSKKEEGIIENVENVWLHPMRHNQYSFTQVAPYPHLRYPLEIGNKWSTSLEMLGTDGDWSYANIQKNHEITDSFTKSYPNIGTLKCWELNATATFKMSTSTLQYFFNEQYGFTELHYVNYIGEKLSVVLKEVQDDKK
ncbi:MAG: hypothetical protein ACPGVB_09460 [Chitinophagales bacterium]